MTAEARHYERSPISRYHKEGSFHIISDDKEFHYLRANNISKGGICIDVPSALHTGEPVQFRYISKTEKLELEGTVAWCREEQTADYANYQIGLQFNTEEQTTSANLHKLLV